MVPSVKDELLFSLAMVVVVVDMRLCNVTPAGWLVAGVTVLHILLYTIIPVTW